MKWIGGVAWVALTVACSKQPAETKAIVSVIETPDGKIAELRKELIGELEKERQANVEARAKLAEDLRRIVREEILSSLDSSKRQRPTAVELASPSVVYPAQEVALADLLAARRKLVMAERKYTQESDQVRMLKERCARLQERYDELRENGAE